MFLQSTEYPGFYWADTSRKTGNIHVHYNLVPRSILFPILYGGSQDLTWQV